jgi:RNA polymerase sigma-70 factor (ECF subfamily)
MPDDLHTAELQALLARPGPAARNELLLRVEGNLRRLASRLLHGYPAVARFEETNDVLQDAVVRLLRALEEVTPENPKQFFGLAATVIRRELIDLYRHYYGPRGEGANRHSHAGRFEPPAASDSAELDRWREFHERVAQLPDAEREVVDLLHYQGMTQADAAALLGVELRTVRRRWQDARVRLARLLQRADPPAAH